MSDDRPTKQQRLQQAKTVLERKKAELDGYLKAGQVNDRQRRIVGTTRREVEKWKQNVKDIEAEED